MPNLQQKARWNDKELPGDIEREWYTIIDKFIHLECNYNDKGEVEPHILHFDEEARKRLYDWQHRFSELCDREGNDTGMTRLSAFIASWKYTSSVSV